MEGYVSPIQDGPHALKEVNTVKKACPFGHEPCALNNGRCNLSPGLYITEFDGIKAEMCGDCLRECQANGKDIKINGRAKSVGKDDIKVKGQGQARSLTGMSSLAPPRDQWNPNEHR